MKPWLLIGYGNPGRGDDGLGPALVERLESAGVEGLELMSDYQLTVDLAYDIASFETVVFADAAASGEAPYTFRSIAPGAPLRFTSHSQSAEGVLYLAETLFGAHVCGFQLGVRGYRFDEFNESLSPGALSNLEASVDFVLEHLLNCADPRKLAEDVSLESADS